VATKTGWRGRILHATRTGREELQTWLRSLRLTAHELEGRTAGGHALVILYAGSAPYRHYLRRLAFTAAGRERELGRYWLWQLPALAKRLGADVRITRRAAAMRRLLAAGPSSSYVPEWVWCARELEDADRVHAKGKEWNSIVKHGFARTVTTDREALRHFYERMYLPLMRSSHGDGAQLMGLDYLLQRVAAGEAELLSIAKGGTAVAGCIIVYDRTEARIFSRGVLDADRDLLRQRVGVALYLYAFAHLLERGYARVNLGRARPFLRDGALRFKLERGAKVTGATRAGILIEPLQRSAGANDFLCTNPWIAEDDEGLLAAFFAGPKAPYSKRAAPAGIHRVAVAPVSEPTAALASPP
jgi:hypothetical protein